MTPMIDVVFLLIVFFLVSLNLRQREGKTEELDLPNAQSGSRASEAPARRIVVNVLPEVRPDGRFMVAGRRMRGAEVARMIGYESGLSDRPLEVCIRTDRTVPYMAVEPIMVACAKSGVWKVAFAVTKR